jgi:hypothetical protein
MRNLALLSVIAVAGAWTASSARAQAPLPAPAPAPASDRPAPAVRPALLFPSEAETPEVQAQRGRQPAPLHDPTEPSPGVRRAIEESQAIRKPAAGSAAAPAQTLGISQINLKARVIGTRQPPIAVLEINGTNYIVHADTNLALSGSNQGMEIHVLELSAEQVRVEVLPLKKTFVLH